MNKPQLKTNSSSHHNGFALVTAMLLLLVMAMLGVSMYGGVNVQEKVAINAKIKTRTLLAADSSIQENWTLSVLKTKMITDPVADDIDDSYTLQDVNIGGVVSICYLGEDEISPGNSTDASVASNQDDMVWKQQKFFAAAYAEEQETRAITTIEQGGFMLLPSSGKDANCNRAVTESAAKQEIALPDFEKL